MPAVRPIPAKPAMLRVQAASGRPIGVDREAQVIRGYILAEEGVFKDRRGEFTKDGIAQIVQLANRAPKGLRSRFTHPSMSEDGLGKYLGRARNAWLEKANDKWRARADLYLSPSSRDTPSGDLGGYVLNLAAEDPDALSTSLVILPEEEYRLNKDGTPVRDADGDVLPPIWKPVRLFATDVVDTGDAVDGMLAANLSADDLPDAVQRRGWEFLDRVFAGQAEEVVRERTLAYLDRYLTARFKAGPVPPKLAAAVAPPKGPPPAPAEPAPPPSRTPRRDLGAEILRRSHLRSKAALAKLNSCR